MDPFVIGVAGFCAFVGLLVLGFPIALALALTSIVGLSAILGVQPTLTLISSTLYVNGSSYTLSVIPLFVAMGFLATHLGASADAYDAVVRWVGRIRGSLGIATVGAATLFSALTGSSIATAIVFARVSAPEMIRHGYDKRLTLGLVASSGAIGMLIPPSILAIVYALITEEPVGAVLLATTGPGLALAACLAAAVFIIAVVAPEKIPPVTSLGTSWKERFESLGQLWHVVIVVVVVIGGMYGGVFTATEAAAVGNAALLVLFIVKLGLTRESWRKLVNVGLETAALTVVIFSIFIFAQVFTRFMVISGISQALTRVIVGADPGPVTLAISASILYIVLGCFIDTMSLVVVTVPLLMPAMASSGADAIWFGMVLILASQIGLITPPVGINLYVVKQVAGDGTTVHDVFIGSIPFLIATIVALGLVIAFPEISLWLTRRQLFPSPSP
jgi:tripartite ATP-independent transporter DctM subunit